VNDQDAFTKWLLAACADANTSYVSPEEERKQVMRTLSEKGLVPQRTIAAYEADRVRVRKVLPAAPLAPRRDGQRTVRARSRATVRSAPARGDPDDGDLDPPPPEWPRCECGQRFPGTEFLERHRRRTGCLGEREHRLLVHRLPRPHVFKPPEES